MSHKIGQASLVRHHVPLTLPTAVIAEIFDSYKLVATDDGTDAHCYWFYLLLTAHQKYHYHERTSIARC
jgi:hypothetical protein